MDAILERILTAAGDAALLEKLLAMPKADLNTLLLKLFQMRAEALAPGDMLKAHQTNRFTRPSQLNPGAYHLLAHRLLELGEAIGIQSKLLSPAAPLGSCAAFGCVSQNNVVSALRGTEILSDPTNMLAVLFAEQLARKEIDNREPLHYCTAARVLRAQKFPDIPGMYSHFGLFCMVSSGKDRGSYACETAMLVKHIAYYQKLFLEQFQAQLSVVVRKRGGYTDGQGFWDRMVERIAAQLPGVPLDFDWSGEGNHYYQGINFKLYITKEDEKVEVGDGGFVNWLQSMTGNPKERCLISGVGIDRLIVWLGAG